MATSDLITAALVDFRTTSRSPLGLTRALALAFLSFPDLVVATPALMEESWPVIGRGGGKYQYLSVSRKKRFEIFT